MELAFSWAMAGAASAHQAATASREQNSQQRAGRTRRTSADSQRAQQGATGAAAAAPAALDSLSRLQQLADASPRVAQLRRLQALADIHYAPVAQLAGAPEEEERVQGQFASAELQPQLQQAPRANNTGLPDQLKSGIESLSGLSLDHVRVHYNSSQPAQLNALAYAQGSDIHLAPGQERHLPHEAWHVVQQAQGRVQPTTQMKDDTPVNDDDALEREADIMGERAMSAGTRDGLPPVQLAGPAGEVGSVAQRMVGFEAELSVPSLGPAPGAVDKKRLATGPDGNEPTPEIEQFIFGGLPYGVNRGSNANFALKPDHNELQGKASALRVKLASMGLLLAVPAESTSNLEYVTPPLDELAAGSTAKLTGQFDAVRDHVNALFPAAKSTVSAIGAPGVNTYTGVPEADLKTWLGSRYDEISALVNAFKDSVKNELYLQATVGILPSAIRDLHRAHTPASAEDAVRTTDLAMFVVDTTVKQLENAPAFKNKTYIKELLNGKPANMFGFGAKAAAPIDYESLMGVIHLTYMYMVGSALNQTNLFEGSSKNSVAFLSKMSNMRHIITKAAPGLQANRPPDDLVSLIDRFFKATKYTTADFWICKGGLEDRRGTKGREATVSTSFITRSTWRR